MLSIKDRNKIITEHYQYITITAKKYCNKYNIKKHEDIEDAVQDCFLEITKDIDKQNTDLACLKTWMDRLIRNTVHDFKNKIKNEPEITDYPISGDEGKIEDEIIFNNFCLQLSEMEKDILKFKLNGYKNKEIALLLNISDDNIRQIISRLRKKYKNPFVTK